MYTRFNKRSKKKTSNSKFITFSKIAIAICLFILVIFSIIRFISAAKLNKSDIAQVPNLPNKDIDHTFSVNELTLYSSANATKSKSVNYGLDISQFTDISFNIQNPTGKVIKSLKICEMFFSPYPKLGNPVFIYKSPLDYGKLNSFEIPSEDEIDFKIVDEETDNFNSPTMYNNLSTPITLTYLNLNVKENFIVRQNESSIFYDGRLLKAANIDITKLACNVSFKVKITDTSDQEYECTLDFEIPFKSEDKTILDGSIVKAMPVEGTFYKIQK